MTAEDRPANPDAIIARIRAEYQEMPGLKLTKAQARRLWNIADPACEELLARLVEAKFLYCTPDGSFIRLEGFTGRAQTLPR